MKQGEVSVLDKLIIITLSALIGFFTYFAAETLLKRDYQRVLHQDIRSAFQQINALSEEVVTTLRKLNDKGIESCDDSMLHYMRQVVFLSVSIKDIGFLEGDQLLCTTGLGQLTTVVLNPEPDFIGPNKAKVWVNMPIILTDLEVYAIVAQLGRFNAVVHRDFLDTLINADTSWELNFINQKTGEALHLAGDEPDSKELQNWRKRDFFLEECNGDIPYCLTVSASTEAFHSYYHLVLLGWKIIALLVFVFFWLISSHFIRHYRSVKARVARGLHQGAFYCLYQPIVEIKTGKVVGCEALARYQDAKGDLYPDEFIPIIASHDNTWKFTRAIIDKINQDLGNNTDLPDGFKVNINFFPQDIESGAILELLDNPSLRREGIKYVVEVTESERLASQAAGNTLSRLSDEGFEIAIDDFGTGYSNLRQIQEYKCHILKIDRSFISDMEAGAIRATLIPHIVDIARKIDARVVAEGIENNMQNQELIGAGVIYGQGYMFGKPMPLNKLVSMMNIGVNPR